jgi:hypothetical protein
MSKLLIFGVRKIGFQDLANGEESYTLNQLLQRPLDK